MLSMTGFGRGDAPLAARRLVAELRSVNHRFIELKMRLGREDAELEAEINRLVREKIERGSLSLALREEVDASRAPSSMEGLVDVARGKQWADAFSALAKSFHSEEVPSLTLICAQAGVVRMGDKEVSRADFQTAVRAAVAAALEALVDMRLREGTSLQRELSARLALLVDLRAEVARLSAVLPTSHSEKLRQRLAALLDGAVVDPARLAQEVAILSERLDVTEELVRLSAHLDEAKRLLSSAGPSGRRLDFLSQEILREVNTIGSKSQSSEITARIIDMKAELERFREQIQNVE